ncbi:RsmB/NOP family class I SAM-dependent RNA methyltransferase [Candidatus Bathyarchaeota archaeon]|nr:RsmB/NOP family class I SAM-dependent RNA methyltransferase [Candidatus Bathyarchaeota archaeon]
MPLLEALPLAIEALSWMESEGLSEKAAVAKAYKQLNIKKTEALKLGYMIVLETIKRKNFIEEVILKNMPIEAFSKLNFGLKNFLRIYVYWMKFKKASFKEAVSLANYAREIFGWRSFNELELALGKILITNLNEVLRGRSEEEKIALKAFHPKWFVKYCIKLMGKPQALKFFKANMNFKHVYLRLNTLKGNEEELKRRIESEGVELEELRDLTHVYLLKKTTKPLVKLEAYSKGLFYIQDKSSCLAVLAANPKPGNVIIDACAAPGGKTSFLAQLMENKGKIYSLDYSKERVKVWLMEMNRMNVKNTEMILCDITKPIPLKIEADVVLLDPPCTGTGTLMKNPSMKWRINLSLIKKFQNIQFKMLENCSKLVKVNGSLIYSTCSITLEENEFLIEKFLKLNPNFKLTLIKPFIGSLGFRGQNLCQRLYPHIHESEGFFIAKIEREF